MAIEPRTPFWPAARCAASGASGLRESEDRRTKAKSAADRTAIAELRHQVSADQLKAIGPSSMAVCLEPHRSPEACADAVVQDPCPASAAVPVSRSTPGLQTELACWLRATLAAS